MKYPFVSAIVSEIAPTLGILVELEPEFGFVGELVFANGKRHLFRNTYFDLNAAGAIAIAKDKGYTSYFLEKHGFKVPTGKAFFSNLVNKNLSSQKRRGIEEAVAYAKQLGLPVFAKPNDLAQGELVVKIHNIAQLVELAPKIFARTHVMRVEQICPGRDYRVVVLDGELIAAYERIPLHVTGDGKTGVFELLHAAQARLDTIGRPNASIDPSDFRIDQRLAHLGLTRDSVIPANQTLRVMDNANLSTGGAAIDVTETIHPSMISLAIKACKTIGLRLAGVDFICQDITQPANGQTWAIIEVNGAPGLDNYAANGDTQRDRVKAMFRKILLALEEAGREVK